MLDSKVVSLSLAITSAILYALCAVAFLLFPSGILKFFNLWFHGIDLSVIASTKPMSITNFLIGLAGIVIVSAVTGLIFTSVYNALQKKGQ